MSGRLSTSQRTVFFLPSDRQIEQCARAICRQLGQTLDPAYNDREIWYGLAQFLKLTARIHMNHLNQENEVEQIA